MMMNIPTTSFYVTGGTLRQDSPSYVERQADTELCEGLQRGEYCYVLTARQMGKSSLMVRTAARLREKGVAVVILDLTAIGQNVAPEQWYGGLLDHLGRDLDLEEPLEAYWLAHERLGPLQRWMGALQEVVLPSLGVRGQGSGVRGGAQRLVIFIDEIDATRSLPFSTDEFFAAIRECFNRRAEHPEFERLTFCLLGVASPSDLIRDTRTTPFNIGRRIELTDFTSAEATALAAGLVWDGGTGRADKGRARARVTSTSTNGSAVGAQALLERVLYWTGGHPYLTQRLCQAVAEAAKVTCAEGVDRLCEALFLCASARERDDNLLFVRERLLRGEADLASLLDLYGQVRAGKPVGVDDTNPLIDLLRLAGIVLVAQGRLRVRNRIYERVFDRAWVAQHMPDAELRRQRAAYRRGLLRATAIATAGMLVVLSLAFTAMRQARRADRSARAEARARGVAEQRTYVADMNLAQLDWETNNFQRLRNLLAETRNNPDRSFEWFFWQRLCHLDLLTLRGGPGAPVSWAFSPDGTRLAASEGGDRTVQIWQLPGGRRLLTLSAHTGQINAVAYSPDGTRIVTGSEDRTAQLWDAATGQPSLTFRGHAGAVRTVAFSPDGRRIVTGGADQMAAVWEARTGQMLRTVRGHTGVVSSAAFSRDGRRLLAHTGDGTARLWDVDTGRALLIVRGETEYGAMRTAFSPDGRRLVSGRGGRSLTLWDAVSGHRITALEDPAGVHPPVAFSPDSRRIAASVAGSPRCMPKLWDASTGRTVVTFRGRPAPIDDLAFSPDGTRLATAGHDGTATLWEVRTGRELRTIRAHTLPNRTIAFSPDGTRIVTGSEDHTARVWEVATGRHLLTHKGHADTLWSVAFSPDGRHVVTGAEDGMKLWAARSDRAAIRLPGKETRVVALSPDGRRVLTGGEWQFTGGEYNTAKVWDAVTGRRLLTLWGHQSPVECGAFSPDGKRVVTGGYDSTARVWDAATGRLLRTLRWRDGYASSVAFSPDGRWIATGGWDRTARIWDAATGQQIALFDRYSRFVWSVAFSPDGRRLVIAAEDAATVWEWSPGTGSATPAAGAHAAASDSDLTGVGQVSWHGPGPSPRKRLVLRGPWVTDAVFSPDGREIVTTDGSDKTAKLWDAATGRLIRTFKGHNLGVTSVDYSLDGRRIVTTGWDHTAKVWNTGTGSETLTLPEAGRPVVFSQRRIATGRRVWEAASPEQVTAWEAGERAAEHRLAAVRTGSD